MLAVTGRCSFCRCCKARDDPGYDVASHNLRGTRFRPADCSALARGSYRGQPCTFRHTKRGKARNNKDFDAADIVAANACTPYVEADSHVILAVDKVKRPGVMGHPGVYAFAYDVVRNDVIFDAGATMLVRMLWSV